MREAAEAALALLRDSAQGELGLVELARGVGVHKSTLHRLLATLARHGYVLHLEQERLYGLGPAAYELSGAYLRQEPLARIGRPVIEPAPRLSESFAQRSSNRLCR